MSLQSWEHFFKPEVRSSGQSLVKQGKLSISQPSDTEIVVFIKASTPSKVILKSKSVESDTFFAQCNCPAGKEGRFCKHVWAALLATEKKNSDFFESKTKIEMEETDSNFAQVIKPTAQTKAREEAEAKLKLKQATYRKEQYQKQKERQKAFKAAKKNRPAPESNLPEDVEHALNFFAANGFELKESLNKESVTTAKKKLSRVFHPDMGGSHEESAQLNSYADILLEFIERQ